MDVVDCFSGTYREAREKFLAAAKAAGAELTSWPHPLTGPSGEALAVDVARIGPKDASRMLVAGSGTHGIEGFCGSGCQVATFRSGIADRLPPDTALLQIHAHNPHGFAHERRVNEDNVDINRNFHDFGKPLPENAGYDEIHRFLVPKDWDGPARAAADKGIADFIASRGMAAFQAAVSGGQYGHADGLFYGGREPIWSNRTLHEIVAKHVSGVRDVAVIDYHTGLGPRGYGEIIVTGGTGGENYDRARQWYGDDVKSPEAGDSASAVVVGTIDGAYYSQLHDSRITFIAIEYGTLPIDDVLQALRADNWLYLHGDVASAQGREIKQQIRAAFYGEDAKWKQDIWRRAEELVGKALANLGR